MATSSKALLEYFSRSLASFQASQDALRVLCTLPLTGQSPAPRLPRRPASKLIVLDSSFNPPTRAHAQMVRSAVTDSKDTRLRVLLLLAVNNADKKAAPASFPSRLGMMVRFGQALLDELNLKDLEMDLVVTTMPYFHAKSAALAQLEGSSKQEFLTGFDTVVRIFDAKYYDKETTEGEGVTGMQAALGPLFKRATLRVTSRPDDSWGSKMEQQEYVDRLGAAGGLESVGGDRAWAERVKLVDGGDGVGISSSQVREAVRTGDAMTVQRSVVDEVQAWIDKEGLYKE